MSAKSEYNKLLDEKKEINNRLNSLMQNESVKEFVNLKSKFLDIDKQLVNLHCKLKLEEYDSCNHIMIYTNDSGPDKRTCGCIKCGLDNSVLDKYTGSLTADEEIMYYYFHNFKPKTATLNAHRICDLKTGMAIYQAIIKKYPEIDDKSALNLFEVTLDNIDTNNIDDELTKKISLVINNKK